MPGSDVQVTLRHSLRAWVLPMHLTQPFMDKESEEQRQRNLPKHQRHSWGTRQQEGKMARPQDRLTAALCQ